MSYDLEHPLAAQRSGMTECQVCRHVGPAPSVAVEAVERALPAGTCPSFSAYRALAVRVVRALDDAGLLNAGGALATLSFQPEAYESAHQFVACLTPNGPRVGGWNDDSGQGYTVHAVPCEGEPFDAEVAGTTVGEDGQYKVILAPWDEAQGRGDRTQARAWDLYDELVRIEVT